MAAHTLVGMMKVFPYDPIAFQEPSETIVKHLRLDDRFMHDDIEIIL